MAKRIQFRGGTTAQHNVFTGAIREITVDTDKDTLVVHDGSTIGGFPLARESVLSAHANRIDNPHSVTKAQVGLNNVDNTADANKVVFSATKWTTGRVLSLGGDATGSVSVDGSSDVTLTVNVVDDSHNHAFGNLTWKPTTVAGYGITDVYTKAQTDSNISTAVAGLVNGSPAALDTLNELAVALGNDANFATTVSASIGTKVTKNANIVAGTGTKITYDTKGLVTSSTTLSASDIPSLDASKITSGTLSVGTSGNAATATNSTQLGGISSNRAILKRRSRIHTADSTSLNSSITAPEMGFSYGGSGEPAGPYICFGGLGGDIDYSCQLTGAYAGGGNDFKIRTRNDDASSWNAWRTIITDGNYNSYSPTLTGGNASGTWGINITGNAATATTASSAHQLNGRNFYWSGQGGQPNWLWGGNDGTNMYVYNPSNFSVNYANSAGNGGVTSVNGMTGAVTVSAGVSFGGIGSILALVCVNNTNYGMGSQVAGSSLRYNTSINQKSTLVKINGTDTFLGDVMGSYYRTNNATYNGGGTAGLSGTWVKITPSASFASYYDGYSTYYYYGCCLWQRIA